MVDKTHRSVIARASRRGPLAALLALSLVGSPAVLVAQESAAERQEALEQLRRDNPVVAMVNDEEIRWVEVVAGLNELPPQYRDRLEEVFPILLERQIDLKLISSAGREDELNEDPQVQQRLRTIEDQLIRELYLERYLAAEMTEERLQEGYETLKQRGDEREEVRARHILVDSEEEAEAIIAELDGGADFAELAERRSQGPSASVGGDLGYFTRERMVPPFAEAAFALQPGSHSAEPVETRFGWHVIKVEDRRQPPLEDFEVMRPQLEQRLQQSLMERLIAELRADADVEVFPEGAYTRPAEDGSAGEQSADEEERPRSFVTPPSSD